MEDIQKLFLEMLLREKICHLVILPALLEDLSLPRLMETPFLPLLLRYVFANLVCPQHVHEELFVAKQTCKSPTDRPTDSQLPPPLHSY